MKISEMTVEQLVHRFTIFKQGNSIGTNHPPINPDQRNELLTAMRTKKPEILQYLQNAAEKRERAARERQEKIDAIPGLAELRDAIEDLNSWNREYSENIHSGASGVGLRAKPQYDLEAMRKKYPRAAAYLKAAEMASAANYAKAAAGKKARERIINGEDCEQALSDAEKEWNDHVSEHIWD